MHLQQCHNILLREYFFCLCLFHRIVLIRKAKQSLLFGLKQCKLLKYKIQNVGYSPFVLGACTNHAVRWPISDHSSQSLTAVLKSVGTVVLCMNVH